jgi:hypothetical protein
MYVALTPCRRYEVAIGVKQVRVRLHHNPRVRSYPTLSARARPLKHGMQQPGRQLRPMADVLRTPSQLSVHS